MKNLKNMFSKITRRTAILAMAALAIAGSIHSAKADSQAFSRIFVFGDSLSDTGNFQSVTGYPPLPYDGGRFSNGKLWIEYTADALRMQIRPGDNYAVAGATTGRSNINDGLAGLEFPGLQDQIDSFTSQHTPSEVTDSLCVVWAGANDFFAAIETGGSPQALIGNGVSNTAQAVVRLAQHGARHILVVNVPDLGLTPYAIGAGLGAPVSQLSAAYNQYLGAALDSLEQAGIHTMRLDSFAVLGAVAANPAKYGFTNVNQPYLAVGGNPDQFLFWDTVHPTTAGHAVIADEVVRQLTKEFSPSRSDKAPAARINALHGLVGK